MYSDSLYKRFTAAFPFQPTNHQQEAFQLLAQFMTDQRPRPLFLLKGYAGTGKTTLVGTLVKVCMALNKNVVLAAPTGRAAKVLSEYAAYPACTIHKLIYRQRDPEVGGRFDVGRPDAVQTLFIVDEASMISNKGEGNFGSGNLLSDLMDYVYRFPGNRLLLLGDDAQLPPVMLDQSPALNEEELRALGFALSTCSLTEVVRQNNASGILQNATQVRSLLNNPQQLSLRTFNDVQRVTGQALLDALEDSYRTVGPEQTLVVTRSNKRAGLYANGIRNRILQREELLCRHDLVMVVKNNYHWGDPYGIDFIANGEVGEITRLGKGHKMYGCNFREAELYLPYYDTEISTLLLEDALLCETPADLSALTQRLLDAVMEDYKGIKNKRKQYTMLRKNEYWCALQIKSAYAVTCHKAQGGQWKHVYVDAGPMRRNELDLGWMRWLYTALTRATERLYLVQFPDEFF